MLYKYFAFAKNHLGINNHDNGEPRTIKVMKYEKVDHVQKSTYFIVQVV